MTEQDQKLIRMAGEIHQFFRHQGDAAAGAAANHIQQFWAPSMRSDFQRVLAEQGDAAPAHIHAIAKALNG